jgi:hypothetical protein
VKLNLHRYFPVAFMLRGYNGPSQRIKFAGHWVPHKNSVLTVAPPTERLCKLVGPPYDVCHTMTFKSRPWPLILDFLVVAEVALEQNHTCAVFPATLFLALETLFGGVIPSSKKGCAFPSAVVGADEMKKAVVDAFPDRQKAMMEHDMLRGYRAEKHKEQHLEFLVSELRSLTSTMNQQVRCSHPFGANLTGVHRMNAFQNYGRRPAGLAFASKRFVPTVLHIQLEAGVDS